MTQQELDALKALADAATPGPWVAAQVPLDDESYYVAIVDGRAVLDTYVSLSDADAAFIAAAREAVPELLAALAERDAEVERLRDELDDYADAIAHERRRRER